MKEMLGDSQHRVCNSLYKSSQLKMAAPLKFYATISHIIYPCAHTTAYVHKMHFILFLHCSRRTMSSSLCICIECTVHDYEGTYIKQ